MTIRFKCPLCDKALAVKDELGGRRGACPACKQAILIPRTAASPTAAELEAMAAEALAEEPKARPLAPVAVPIKFTCTFCDEENEFPADLGGKQAPCPSCKRIVKIPLPKVDKPKDWRELVKKGPSAALINQPEQLDGAWGAEVKTRVSGAALEEAGAIVEEAEPIGALGWAKRVAVVLALVVLVGGGYLYMNRRQSISAQTDHLKEALQAVKNKEVKLAPLLAAEIHRGAGVIYLREGKGEAAQREFNTALAYLRSDTTDNALDFDQALLELALSQCDLGGDKNQILAKERFDWQRDVQLDLETTLATLRGPEAKAWAMRNLGTRLLEKKQDAVAVALATGLANATSGDGGKSPILAPLVGLLLARPELGAKAAAKLLDPPVDSGKGFFDGLARSAYAEGHQRRGQFEEAKKIVQMAGPDRHRFEACLDVGGIAAADPKFKGETLYYYQEAKKINEGMKDRITPWQLLQLANLALAAGAIEEAKELAKGLLPNYLARWQLEKIRADLAKASGSVPVAIVEEVTDAKSSLRPLAWFHLARHQARLGRGGDVADAAAALDPSDAPILAMVHLGLALGEQERRQ